MSKSFYSAKTTRKRNNSAGPLRCLGVRPWCKLHLTIVSGKCQVTRAADVVQCLTLGLRLVTPRCQIRCQCMYGSWLSLAILYIGSSVVMSPTRIHMSAGALITWCMPMLLAALVAKCPQTGADVFTVQISHNTKHFNKCDEKN